MPVFETATVPWKSRFSLHFTQYPLYVSATMFLLLSQPSHLRQPRPEVCLTDSSDMSGKRGHAGRDQNDLCMFCLFRR
jgi:hypothetical protein